MRAQGREVPPLDHDTVLPGSEPARRLVVIGDSAAAGHGLADATQAYAWLVATELSRGDGRATQIVNVAVDGATIGDALAQQRDAARDAEVVVVSIGVNDAIRRHRPASVRAGMGELLTGIRGLAAPDARVVLIAAPDLSVAPGLPRPLCLPLGVLCRTVARVQEEVAVELGVPVIRLPRNVLPPEVFGDDGFHPGTVGHEILADALLEHLGAGRSEGSGARG